MRKLENCFVCVCGTSFFSVFKTITFEARIILVREKKIEFTVCVCVFENRMNLFFFLSRLCCMFFGHWPLGKFFFFWAQFRFILCLYMCVCLCFGMNRKNSRKEKKISHSMIRNTFFFFIKFPHTQKYFYHYI